MDFHDEEPSGLSRFAIPEGAPVPPLRADLVADYEAAVEREHFDYEDDQQDD